MSQEDLDKYVKDERRKDLYGSRQSEAMACVQPFALVDETLAMGIGAQDATEMRKASNDLGRLNRLWIIDRHRPSSTQTTGTS